MTGLALAALFALAGAPATPAMPDLAFLAGSWQTRDGGSCVEEQWTEPGPDSMYATGRTVEAGKTVFFEFLRIEARADGVYYVAQPKGRPPTDFKLTKREGDTLVFENPERDYPKKITYAKAGDGLVARVEGSRHGKDVVEEFRYRRPSAPCR